MVHVTKLNVVYLGYIFSTVVFICVVYTVYSVCLRAASGNHRVELTSTSDSDNDMAHLYAGFIHTQAV